MSQKYYISKSIDFSGDPADVLDLFRDEPHTFFLDSSQHDPHRGRYSFIGFDPFDTFTHTGKNTVELLREKFSAYAEKYGVNFQSEISPLTSGIVGCLGYDYGLSQENIQTRTKNDFELPDGFFGFYDCILTFDHFTRQLIVTSSGLPEKNNYLREKRAQSRLSYIINKLSLPSEKFLMNSGEDPVLDEYAQVQFKSNMTQAQYLTAARKALEYIGNGDIYQVNLSQRFQFDLNGMPFDPYLFYRILRQYSPAPFGGFMDCGEFQLMSNSPERFLSLNNNIVQTRPMKGTRPRGDTDAEDQKLREQIISSDKEKAELLMITDLLRNDLGRVCEYGSITVKEMRVVEEYKHVFQATSTVEGALRNNKDCFDLIKACFPGGSITGCPKIRAMEIIEELEPCRRGMYTGIFGYIDFAGNMDFNILIRTLLASQGSVHFQVGGGIVSDSSPENEYQETLVKAKAIQNCLRVVISKEAAEKIL